MIQCTVYPVKMQKRVKTAILWNRTYTKKNTREENNIKIENTMWIVNTRHSFRFERERERERIRHQFYVLIPIPPPHRHKKVRHCLEAQLEGIQIKYMSHLTHTFSFVTQTDPNNYNCQINIMNHIGFHSLECEFLWFFSVFFFCLEALL